MEIRALLSAMGRNKTGPILVAAQVAITLAVLVNVAYIIQYRLAAIAEPTGLDAPNIFWIVSQSYSPEYNHAAAVEADLDYLQSIPGVIAATTTGNIPQGSSNTSLPFAAEESVLQKGGGVPAVVFFGSANYTQTLGVKLASGRPFDPAAVQPPVKDFREMMGNWGSEVIITKNLAAKLWPNQNPLGKTLYTGLVNKPATVVGIIDYMQHRPTTGPVAELFRTIVIVPTIVPGPGIAYMVRTEPGRRDATMARVEKELEGRQPGRYIAAMEALEMTMSRQRQGARTSIFTLGIVAIFVLGVTVVGIVGLAAFTVATRTKQLGTRRAIGATKFHILRYFLVENWLITTVGALVGCALAVGVGIKLSLMYQMPRLPLLYLVGGVVTLWVLGVLAVWLPARRAASISPAVATRTV